MASLQFPVLTVYFLCVFCNLCILHVLYVLCVLFSLYVLCVLYVLYVLSNFCVLSFFVFSLFSVNLLLEVIQHSENVLEGSTRFDLGLDFGEHASERSLLESGEGALLVLDGAGEGDEAKEENGSHFDRLIELEIFNLFITLREINTVFIS